MRGEVAIQALLVESLALALSFNVTAGMIVGGIAAALGGISLIFSAFAEKPSPNQYLLRMLNIASFILGIASIAIYVAMLMGWL